MILLGNRLRPGTRSDPPPRAGSSSRTDSGWERLSGWGWWTRAGSIRRRRSSGRSRAGPTCGKRSPRSAAARPAPPPTNPNSAHVTVLVHCPATGPPPRASPRLCVPGLGWKPPSSSVCRGPPLHFQVAGVCHSMWCDSIAFHAPMLCGEVWYSAIVLARESWADGAAISCWRIDRLRAVWKREGTGRSESAAASEAKGAAGIGGRDASKGRASGECGVEWGWERTCSVPVQATSSIQMVVPTPSPYGAGGPPVAAPPAIPSCRQATCGGGGGWAGERGRWSHSAVTSNHGIIPARFPSYPEGLT